MIHEFRNPINVHTPHGKGQAFFLIDYGLTINSVWVVRLEGGKILHYYSDDIRIYDNPMNGKNFDLNIPENWKK
jgi:hypothetical protein